MKDNNLRAHTGLNDNTSYSERALVTKPPKRHSRVHL